MKLSVVVPIYNEEDNIRSCYSDILESLSNKVGMFELILVDDGSQDNSSCILKEIAAQDPRVKIIRFRRNFGQTAAMAAGFEVAKGSVIVPMDGDLQNDPSDIPRMLDILDQGFDVVSGWRKDRQDKWLSRKLPSILANKLISKMTGVNLHDYGCSLKAYRAELLKEVNLYGELHRFVPALAHQFGARVTETPVNHRARLAGKSKYGIDRTLRVVLDLLTVKFLLSYSTRPLQLFGKWGVVATLFSGATGVTALYLKFADGLSLNRNPLTVLSAFLLFSGFQFFALGLLGELVTRTYHETQRKPVYKIWETYNLGDS